MHTRTSSTFVVLIGVFLSGIGAIAFAQGTMARPQPSSTTRDSTANLKTDNGSTPNETMARGVTTMADGSIPQQLVEINTLCGGATKIIAVADSKGRFSFNPSVLSDITDPKGCVLRAFLEGYRSEAKPLSEVNLTSSTRLGKLVLQSSSPDSSGLVSANDAQASKNPKKAYDKGLDDAAKQEWPNAMASLQKATAAYPAYSSAWLSLGILQQSAGDRDAAQKSFAQSAATDGRFALPLIWMAALDAARADWQATVDHTQKAIDLNPAAFPHAYELNAIANLNLQNIDLAEKSAIEGIKLDTEHRFPGLEYAQGMLSKVKNDRDGVLKHLQAYLDEAPNGQYAASAKKELAQLQATR